MFALTFATVIGFLARLLASFTNPVAGGSLAYRCTPAARRRTHTTHSPTRGWRCVRDDWMTNFGAIRRASTEPVDRSDSAQHGPRRTPRIRDRRQPRPDSEIRFLGPPLRHVYAPFGNALFGATNIFQGQQCMSVGAMCVLPPIIAEAPMVDIVQIH